MRNSTAAHTGWLLLLLLAITATTIWLFAGAQWDQSSIFRPTVQFLSFFGDFWQFLAVHSGTKAQFSVPLCNFCHFLSFFAVFWQFFGNFWWFSVNFWRFLTIFGDFCQFLAIFDNFWWLIIHIMRGACCWPNKKGRALALKQELCLLVCPKSGTCEKFAGQSGGALVHNFPNIEFFSSTSNPGLVQILLLNLGEHWCTTFPT